MKLKDLATIRISMTCPHCKSHPVKMVKQVAPTGEEPVYRCELCDQNDNK